MPRTQYPRALVGIRVPIMGNAFDRRRQQDDAETILFSVVPRRVSVSKNDFNQADEAHLTLGMEQAGVDPRLLSNANIEVFLTDAGSVETWQPKDSDRRFVGIVTRSRRRMSEAGMSVELEALDYTTMFLAQKPFGDTGMPKYSDTLAQAWERICDHVGYYDYDDGGIVSTVELLRDRLEFLGAEGTDAAGAGIADIPIGEFVLQRVRSKGIVQADPNADAWSIWRTICDSLGLITYIDGDRCVVATPSAYYEDEDDPIALRWGDNVEEMEEGRDHTAINGRGIHLTSFDPVSFSAIEAFFPERDDDRVPRRKRLKASGKTKKKKAATSGLVDIKQYEHFDYPYPATEEALATIAERIFQERSRQELRGHVKTSEMTLLRASGREASVFDLRHGGPVLVSFDTDVLDPVRRLESVQLREAYLREIGYQPQIARLLAEDAGFLQRLLPVFAVTGIQYEIEDEKWDVTVSYASRFDPNTGSTE